MGTVIHKRVEMLRDGAHPAFISRLESGWAVLGDVQVRRGYALLLPDPVVPTLNDLDEAGRATFLRDMGRLGDAILAVTGAARVNYSMLGNLEPALHAHLFPRYDDEPEAMRQRPIWFEDWNTAPRFDPDRDGDLVAAIRDSLHADGSH